MKLLQKRLMLDITHALLTNIFLSGHIHEIAAYALLGSTLDLFGNILGLGISLVRSLPHVELTLLA